MKLELPLAVILIAGGCWLWATQYLRPPETQAETAVTQLVEAESYAPGTAQGSLTALPVAAISRPANATPQSGDSAPQSEPPQPAFVIDPQTSQLVARAAKELSASPPVSCSVRLTMNMFESVVTATGSYAQQGEGKNRAKLEVNIGDEISGIRLQQICDGRFYYRRVISGESRTLEFIDLERAFPSLIGNDSLVSYSTLTGGTNAWMMTGNVAGLIEHLATSFTFGPVHETSLGDLPTLTVRGIWNEQELRFALAGQLDHELLVPEIDWAQLPEQIPHAVEITFGNDDFLPLFPYRIAFLRFGTDENKLDNVVETTVVELYDVTRLNSINENIFKVDTDDVEVIDKTYDYIEQMERRHESLQMMQDQLASGNLPSEDLPDEMVRTAQQTGPALPLPDPASSRPGIGN